MIKAILKGNDRDLESASIAVVLMGLRGVRYDHSYGLLIDVVSLNPAALHKRGKNDIQRQINETIPIIDSVHACTCKVFYSKRYLDQY